MAQMIIDTSEDLDNKIEKFQDLYRELHQKHKNKPEILTEFIGLAQMGIENKIEEMELTLKTIKSLK